MLTDCLPRVCFVLTSPFAVNGFLLNHFRVLADHFSITLLVNTREHPLSLRLDSRVRVIHLEIVRKVAVFFDAKTLWILWRFFLNEKFDLVHSLTPKAGLLAMLAAALSGIKCRQHTFTGQVWATKLGIKRWGLKQLDRLIVLCASHVLADSFSQCRFLEQQGVVRSGIISVAGAGSISGVDLERFSPSTEFREIIRSQLDMPSDAFVFIALGRITKDKGVFDLVASFKSLAKENDSVWLLIAGPDEDGLESTLLSNAGDSVVRLRIVPVVVKAEEYLAAGDALVLPSYREGFGTVVIEAAGVGLPAIVSRIYGLTDAVVDGVTGIQFPVGDQVALCNAMKKLVLDSNLRENLATCARERALKEFSADSISYAWLSQYRYVLDAAK